MSLQPQNLEDPLSQESQLFALLELNIPISELAPEVQDYWRSRFSDGLQSTTSSNDQDDQDEQKEQGELQPRQVLDEGDGLQVDDAPDLSSPSEWSSSATSAQFDSTPSDTSAILLGPLEGAPAVLLGPLEGFSSNTTLFSPEYVIESRDEMSEALPRTPDDDFGATQSTYPVRLNVSTDARHSAANLRRAPGVEIFRCPLYPSCESTFTRKGAIPGHMESHKDQKLHACTVPRCNYRGNTRKLLHSHLQHVHNKEGK